MRFTLKILFLILLFVPLANAQELSRSQNFEELRIISAEVEQKRREISRKEERLRKIVNDLIKITPEDKTEAEKSGARAVRLFPDEILDKLIAEDEVKSFSICSIWEITDAEIEYKKGSLTLVKEDNIVGFLGTIGGELLENVTRQNQEVIALTKYQPPEKPEDAESEFSIDGLNFGKSVPVIVGNTYIFRGIIYGEDDGIVSFKIHRKDSDGSIVLFIKKILNFVPPMLRVSPELSQKDAFFIDGESNSAQPTPGSADYATEQAVQMALHQKGFYDVFVMATTTEITLRGTVPKGKMGEMVMIATEVGKRKVNNQVTEK